MGGGDGGSGEGGIGENGVGARERHTHTHTEPWKEESRAPWGQLGSVAGVYDVRQGGRPGEGWPSLDFIW